MRKEDHFNSFLRNKFYLQQKFNAHHLFANCNTITYLFVFTLAIKPNSQTFRQLNR